MLHHHQGGGEHHLQEGELTTHRGGAPLRPPRGSRGGRGGPAQQQRGRGSRGSRGNRGGNVGGKRKADGYNQPDSKRRQTSNQQNWGSQPIAQQPLQQGGDYSGNYGYNNDNQEFYQDTYGPQWKQTSEGLKVILTRYGWP